LPLTDDPAEQAIFLLLAARGDKSICPTEAARALANQPADDSWRKSLPAIRQAAFRLARAGRIDILRKGKPVAPEDAHGVIRLRMKAPS
jgi:hypothetical protein